MKHTVMKKREFNKLVRKLIEECREGFFGWGEMIDEIWWYIYAEQERNKDLWKEVKRLRKKYEPEKHNQ